MSDTIWDRYGGYGFVAKAVDDFYARVLLSRNLDGYFENIDMEQLIRTPNRNHRCGHGRALRSGCRSPAPAHAHLKIKNDHFQRSRRQTSGA